MMNLIDQRTTPDGLARLARPWQATLALVLALLPAAGTAAAQDTTPPPLKSARINGTTLTLAFDKPVVIGTTSLLVQGFTVGGISNSGNLHPSAMRMDNRTATFALDMAAEPGQTVTVSYDPDDVPNTPPTPGYPNGRHMPLRVHRRHLGAGVLWRAGDDPGSKACHGPHILEPGRDDNRPVLDASHPPRGRGRDQRRSPLSNDASRERAYPELQLCMDWQGSLRARPR